MPLLDLKTDLKSLKYGQDTQGGGNSREPYIKVDINKVDSGFNQFRLTNFDDGLVRGGIVGAANASVVDTLRIGKFFADFPKGPLFLVKQVGLQLSNPQLEHKTNLRTDQTGTNRPIKGQGVFRNVGNAITNAATAIGPFIARTANRIENEIGPTRIYNLGINTLAQVPLNAFGGHLLRHGLLPTDDQDKLYLNVVQTNNKNNSNRLVGYTNTFYLGGFREQLKFETNPELTRYIGGPSSVYGIGNTIIRKSYDAITNNWDNINRSLDFSKTKTSNSYPSQVLSTLNGGRYANFVNYLKLFSIFDTKDKFELEGIEAYTDKIKDFNSTINTRISNARKRATQPQLTTANPNIPSAGTSSNVTVTSVNAVRIKNANDIKGDRTSRTWRTPEELKEDLDKAYGRNINLLNQNDFGLVASENQTIQQFPGRLLGLSKLDTELKLSTVNQENGTGASIYDRTAVPYTDIQPALRKYSELTKAIEYTVAGKSVYGAGSNSDLYNTINSDTLLTQNKTNSQLSAGGGGIILNNPSVTAFSTTALPNGNITYNNGILGDKPVTIKFNSWNAVSREVRIGSGRQDSINLTRIFGGTMAEVGDKYFMGDEVVTIDGKKHNIRDLVKFRISSVLTDTPERVSTMVFRAYLTQLTDSVDATWNDVKYAGRGNKFYIYDGFTRKIQIGFKVAALSAEEMSPMYSKLNYLMSNLMPDYDNGLMRGPLVRMTVGNYFDAQLGKLDSLSYTIPQDSPWEIALDEPEGGTKQLILPHILEVSLGFTPIGAETQGENKIEEKIRSTTYLAQNNTGTDKDTIQYYDYFSNKFSS
jgi:hypothetical protein